MVFCFARPEDAEAFAERFGGQPLPAQRRRGTEPPPAAGAALDIALEIYYPLRVVALYGEAKAHYDLAEVQAKVILLGVQSFTKTALDGGRTMGLTTNEMVKVVASLSRYDFYKSMTTYADHKTWQDVYHADTPVGKVAYIKITMRDEAPVIQFKEKE